MGRSALCALRGHTECWGAAGGGSAAQGGGRLQVFDFEWEIGFGGFVGVGCQRMLPLEVAGRGACGAVRGGWENALGSGICEKVRGLGAVGTRGAIQLGIVSLA